MKRNVVSDLARNFRSQAKFRYAIEVARRLGGVVPRECNLCGYEGLFHATGHPPCYDSECLRCASQERHRLLALLLKRNPWLGEGYVIHFAPAGEQPILELLKERATSCRTADPSAPGSDLRLDIEAMDLPDESVDLFVVNHVLEHVDDERALDELHRCLSPGGAALITAPLVEGWAATHEDGTIATGPSDELRTLHFGRADRIRLYGADLRDRIKAAGFKLSRFTATPEESIRHGLIRGESVFIATKV